MTIDALNLCNACDAAPAATPGGYCHQCDPNSPILDMFAHDVRAGDTIHHPGGAFQVAEVTYPDPATIKFRGFTQDGEFGTLLVSIHTRLAIAR